MKYLNLMLIPALLSIAMMTAAQTFEVYVSDAGNFDSPPWQILKFDENGENPAVFINTNLAWPQDILFLEEEDVVLISNLNSGRINRHDATTGDYIDNFATGIGGPTRMKIGPDNLLYVLQWQGNGRVQRYEQDGTFVDAFTDVGVAQSIGLDWDRQGNLYVSSFSGKAVRKFDGDGNDMGLFVDSNLQGPTNIWFDGDGDLLVADWSGTAVKRFDASGNFVGNFLTGLSQCEGVAFYPDGRILVGNGLNGSVKLFDPEGNFLEDFIPPGLGGLLTPNAVVLREMPSSAVRNIQYQSHLIYPAAGSAFFLSTPSANGIEDVTVFDAIGQVLYTGQMNGSQVWDAGSVAEGIYVAMLRDRDGIMYSQKLLVFHP